MSRVRTLFVTVLPSAIAGGFLFASAFGHAETGRDALGYWPVVSDTATGAVVVAQADPRPVPPRYRGGPVPPVPPAPPAPPVVGVPVPPPPPPPHHGRGRHGVSVSIHDGKVEIDGIAELVETQLEAVGNLIDNLPDVPADVRGRVRSRIQSVRNKIHARIGRLKALDLDKLDRLGPEMERMGDEIEREMEGLDKELEQLGDKIGKGFAKKFGKDIARSFATPPSSHDSDDADDDDDDDDDRGATVMPPGVDIDIPDPADLAPAIAALKGLTLDARQKEQLAKLRADSDGKVAAAKRDLEQMSNRLHDVLADGSASEDDIARQIDSISQKEATIRKARILTWVKARNLLRQDQRKMIEAAVKKSH